jgi:hypothetical protein
MASFWSTSLAAMLQLLLPWLVVVHVLLYQQAWHMAALMCATFGLLAAAVRFAWLQLLAMLLRRWQQPQVVAAWAADDVRTAVRWLIAISSTSMLGVRLHVRYLQGLMLAKCTCFKQSS